MTLPPSFLEKSDRNGQLVIAIRGEIDLSNAALLGREIEEAIFGAMSVAIDLTPVQYLDSQGVRLLYQLSRRMSAQGTELVFIAPLKSIAGQVLKLSSIEDLVPVVESLA